VQKVIREGAKDRLDLVTDDDLPSWSLRRDRHAIEAAKDRIRALIRDAPDDFPGAPLSWVELVEQPALDELIEAGEVQAVDAPRVTRPDLAATYLRFRPSSST
jgi:hypothetical protein